MAQLGEVDLTTTVVSANNVAPCGRHPASPRGGKRPRTTSSTFTAAATGMLTGTKSVVEGGFSELPSPLPKSKDTGTYNDESEVLFRLRRHVEACQAADSVPAVDNLNKPPKKVLVGRSLIDSNNAGIFARSATESQQRRTSRSSREDAFREAEAMAADEGRISPPSPLLTRSLGHLRPSEVCRIPPTEQRKVDEASEPGRSFGAISRGVNEQGEIDRRPAMPAVPSDSLLAENYPGGSAAAAPAFEPPPSKISKTAPETRIGFTPETRRNVVPGITIEVGHEQPRDSRKSYGTSGPRSLCHDISSRTAGLTTPQIHHEEEPLGGHNGDIYPDEQQQQQQQQQQQDVTLSSVGKKVLRSPEVDRNFFLSVVAKSDVSYNSVREDLLQYMEGVRARTSEDGTPSVTFPGNFDRIVGLMDRRDLEDRSIEGVSKGPQRSCNQNRNTRDESEGDFNKEKGKARGKERGDGEGVRPWTKYLLEEGLDRTAAFSRYRGMFADEQTEEDRFMRGLAKMRELDLRLARVTGRARELKLVARDAAEQAERAAMGVASSINERAAYFRPQGRGPVAIEDGSANRPPLRLPLPLSTESAPFGPVSSRVSDASARRTDVGGGSGGSTAALGTERSEISATSGSQHDLEGGGGINRRDGRARGGRAFVTQK
ncbi:unnamed protein product [Hapterophycus canaliculatus]